MGAKRSSGCVPQMSKTDGPEKRHVGYCYCYGWAGWSGCGCLIPACLRGRVAMIRIWNFAELTVQTSKRPLTRGNWATSLPVVSKLLLIIQPVFLPTKLSRPKPPSTIHAHSFALAHADCSIGYEGAHQAPLFGGKKHPMAFTPTAWEVFTASLMPASPSPHARAKKRDKPD